MYQFRRYLSLLLFLLIIFPVFSVVAHAENVDIPPYMIMQNNQLGYQSSGAIILHNYDPFIFTPHNGVIERDFKALYDTYNLGQLKNGFHRTTFTYRFLEEDGSSSTQMPIMLEANTKYKVTMKNIYHSFFVDHLGYQYYVRNPKLYELGIVYEDGDYELLDIDYELNHTPNTPFVDLVFNITVEKPVQNIVVSLVSEFNDSLPASFWELEPGFPALTTYLGEYGNGETDNIFTLEIEPEEVGLLKSIIEWLQSIYTNIEDTYTSITSGFSSVVLKLTNGFENLWDKLNDGFETVVTNITNVVTRIIELPQILWDKISEGLKALFVPSEEDMATYSDKWDELLAQRFGALYEAGDVVDSVVGSITNTPSTVAAEGKITIPQVSLDKFGIPFTFGGYEVDIRPQGFDSIITICKRAISIICTLAFVNALRKRYESVMGG